MDWFKEFTDRLVSAIRAALAPKFDAAVAKMEAAVHQIEGLRGDVAKLSAKIDKLSTGGGLTPAQLQQLTDLTAQLHVSAETLHAAVAAQSTTTP